MWNKSCSRNPCTSFTIVRFVFPFAVLNLSSCFCSRYYVFRFVSMIWLYSRQQQPNQPNVWMYACVHWHSTSLEMMWFYTAIVGSQPRDTIVQCTICNTVDFFPIHRCPSLYLPFNFILILWCLVFFWWRSDLVAVIFGCWQLYTGMKNKPR